MSLMDTEFEVGPLSLQDRIYSDSNQLYGVESYKLVSRAQVSQSKIHNEKLVQTLLKGHSTLSLGDSLSGDYDLEKNDFDYAMGRSITVMSRSIIGYGLILGCARSLKANLQHMEALSTTEAGYMTIHNEKVVQTLLKGHSTLSFEDSLSGDCDMEKNGNTPSSSSATLLLSTYYDDYPMPTSLPKQTPTHINPPTAHVSPCELCHDASPTPLVHTSQSHNDQPTPTSPIAHLTTSTSSHPMVTRSKVDTVKTRHIFDLTHVSSSALHQALFASKEPKGFKTAA
ncbi:hypothetical protein Tco_0737201 [Tanacetum coccineum]